MNMKRSSFTNFLFVFSVLLNIVLIITIILLLKNTPATETTYTIHESVTSISDAVLSSDSNVESTTTSTETTTETTITTTTVTKPKTKKTTTAPTPAPTTAPTPAPTTAPTQAPAGDNDTNWVDGWY